MFINKLKLGLFLQTKFIEKDPSSGPLELPNK